MAIIIPSKNIYQRENQKIIDNAIANVYLQENVYNVNIIQMFSMDNAIGSSTASQEKTFIGDWGTGGEGKRIRFELECVYDEYTFTGTSSDTIRNDEIKLLTHITTQGNESAENYYDYEYLAKQQTFVYEMEDIPLPIPASTDFSEIAEYVNEKIKDNIFYSLEILSGSVKASITISFLKSVTVYLAEEYLLNGEWYGYKRNTIGVSPTITTLELSLYLNYSKVNSTARTIGKSGLSYQLNKNELFQKDTIYNEKPISGYIADQILTSYKNGKETATLICSISDYFDENGEKVISIDTERMSFRMYDKVLPMIYGVEGQDLPMSKMKNGEPKYFVVIGSKIYYDGAVWQELYLQEA